MCPASNNTPASASRPVEVHGHRGCRGLMPENSLPAFLHALDLGVDMLEMDVVITGDGQPIVSHEPWFNPEICTPPNGQRVEPPGPGNNLFELPYAAIRAWDCGTRQHPRFPGQQPQPVAKPLLADVVEQTFLHARQNGGSEVRFNIELKSQPDWDGIFHPEPNRFAALVVEVLDQYAIRGVTLLQSFDYRILRSLRQLAPDVALSVLVDHHEPPDAVLERLTFQPEVYSPRHDLVDSGVMGFVRECGMKLAAWTANQRDEFARLVDLGVDAIITDFPDQLIDFITTHPNAEKGMAHPKG
ncbi:MAG: glycerophosphodiester phosphodiesterase family protein [Bacteroidota bacterium]